MRRHIAPRTRDTRQWWVETHPEIEIGPEMQRCKVKNNFNLHRFLFLIIPSKHEVKPQ